MVCVARRGAAATRAAAADGEDETRSPRAGVKRERRSAAADAREATKTEMRCGDATGARFGERGREDKRTGGRKAGGAAAEGEAASAGRGDGGMGPAGWVRDVCVRRFTTVGCGLRRAGTMDGMGWGE